MASFDLLLRQLQQRVPIQVIFAHINELLVECEEAQVFQKRFIEHIAYETCVPIDQKLLRKIYSFLLNRFDRLYNGQRYALEDEFVEYFASSNENSFDENDGKCDRYYVLDDSKTIHIRTNDALVSEGTTGYSLWDASVALLHELYANRNGLRSAFLNKRVLELGSGTGLGGLAVASLCQPLSSIVLSDIQPVHDSYTLPNLLLNADSLASCPISSEVLYWNDLSAQVSERFDVVFGCDLVYDPDLSGILLDALSTLIFAPNSRINFVVLFCTLRNPQTFEEFYSKVLLWTESFTVSLSGISTDLDDNPIVLQSFEAFRVIELNRKC